MFSKHTKKRGFTLIELLLAVFIFSVLAGLVLANFNRGAKNDDLRRAATEMASILRKAQGLALIGSQQNLPVGSEGLATGKFGVHFDQSDSTYLLFLDWLGGGDGQYQEAERLPNASYHLPKGIIINQLTPVVGNFLDITFWPPKPVIYFNNSATGDPTATIELKQDNTDNCRYIKINRLSGQISVENQ